MGYLCYNYYKEAKKYKNGISIKESLDLVKIPVITFKQGNRDLHFIVDTGADINVIHKGTLDEIQHIVLPTTVSTYTVTGESEPNQVVGIIFSYKDNEYKEGFQVIDMSPVIKGMNQECNITIDGIIGSKFMKKYKYIIDFKELLIYTN
jgi:hypothetical protein